MKNKSRDQEIQQTRKKTKQNYTKGHQVKLLETSYKKEILNSSKEKKYFIHRNKEEHQ